MVINYKTLFIWILVWHLFDNMVEYFGLSLNQQIVLFSVSLVILLRM
jgi:hypothetical protein